MNLYNNRYFKRLSRLNYEDTKRYIDTIGAAVTNEPKFNDYNERQTKSDFWFNLILLGIILFIIIESLIRFYGG